MAVGEQFFNAGGKATFFVHGGAMNPRPQTAAFTFFLYRCRVKVSLADAETCLSPLPETLRKMRPLDRYARCLDYYEVFWPADPALY